MPGPLSCAQYSELQRRMDRQRVLAEQDELTPAEKAELLELTTVLSALFCASCPVAERAAALEALDTPLP